MPEISITQSYQSQPRRRRRSRGLYFVSTRLASIEVLYPLTFANNVDSIITQNTSSGAFRFPYTFPITFSASDDPEVFVDNTDPISLSAVVVG